jgi:hypothetical protein
VIFPLVGFIVQSRGLGIENIIGMATVGSCHLFCICESRKGGNRAVWQAS